MLNWLKDALPNRLYARAALILVAPVVVLTLAVTIAFLQRHFDDVTRQLSRGITLEAELIQHEIATRDGDTEITLMELSRLLSLDAMLDPDAPDESSRPFYDISGIVVLRTFEAELNGFRAVDLASDLQNATLWVDTVAGPLRLRFDRERISASNPHQLVLITLFVAVLMSIVSFVFLRNQLRPIKRLSAAAEAFGKGRTLPYKPGGALEVRAAGLAFLDMRDRIERQIEQRTLMLSGVSHDLRTPLTRMKLELSLLEPSAEVDALEKDLSEMETLLEAFLTFARSAALEDAVETDPHILAENCVGKARRLGFQVRLIEGNGAGQLTLLRPGSMARALDNLIGNAARYATKAEVNVEVEEDRLVIIVEDDGPGIPKDRREEATRPFARLDRARNQDKGSGVGLGLAIVADVARSHGGSLKLDDGTRLGGLKASLILPR